MTPQSNVSPTDHGHVTLINDLMLLMEEVRKSEFHDFRNTKYPAPKIELASKFQMLRENVINGKYDN